MEGYILGGRNIAESEMKNHFLKVNGSNELEDFEKAFRDNFITQDDFKKIRQIGANTVRLPFNYKLIEKQPYEYDEKGFEYIDKALLWAYKNKLGVILDLHAACGSQNCDWHSDSTGKALLWDNEEYRKRTIVLWGKIADRYKNTPGLIGYDILNEPVLEKANVSILKEFYKSCIKGIRLSDKTHKIYLEGNIWGQQIDFLKNLIDENVSVSIHTYCPLNFTFNFVPCLHYPGKLDGELWNQIKIYRYLDSYHKFAKANKAEIYVGEFGVNWRGGHFGELKWLDGMLKAFDEYHFDYTYWTYKAIAGSAFPDGIYQYFGNNSFVKREGPVYGFENYINLWASDKNNIIKFWKTKNFTANKQIISVLKKHFSSN